MQAVMFYCGMGWSCGFLKLFVLNGIPVHYGGIDAMCSQHCSVSTCASNQELPLLGPGAAA